MNRFFYAGVAVLLFPFMALAGGGQIQLKVGSVTIDPTDLSSASCIQVPILINDPSQDNRDLRDLTVTFELSGDTGIIDGGIVANMMVANGFAPQGSGTGTTGITNPGTDLANANGAATPSCSSIFNQATQGSGSSIDFAPVVNANAGWFINNNVGAVGRKQGFLIDLATNASIGAIPQNTDVLIGVLEIPIIANPGIAQLGINAVPNAVVLNGNSYTWDAPKRGLRVLIAEEFDITQATGAVNIFGVPDCSAATTTPTNPDWLDPQAGGLGAELTFDFPGTGLVDQISLTSSDGLDMTIPAAGASTSVTIDTVNDGSPTAGANRSYTATYEVEFPPASGTYVGGAPCNLSPDFAPGEATIAFDPATPIPGQPFSVDVTLTNAVWDGMRFGEVSIPVGGPIDLTAPTSTVGNTLFFDDVFTVGSASVADQGTYMVSGTGPDGVSTDDSIILGFTPPVNQTDCSALSSADIEGFVTVPLQGNAGVVDWDVVYNGVTTNLPGSFTSFDVFNIVGDATSITISANGFDAMGTPVSDSLVCDIDYNLPTSSCSQDPNSATTPVDIGTVITLTLDSTNGITADVDGVPMTPDVNPNTNFNVEWTATHVAVQDIMLAGSTINPDGDDSICGWTINVIEEPVVTVSPTSGLVTTEDGGSDTFSISIDVQPTDDVSFGISSTNPGEGVADTSAVVFTPGNWMNPQIVTVTGVDDAVLDGDVGYAIVVDPGVSTDSRYNGLDPDDVSATNQDNDAAFVPAIPIPTLNQGGMLILVLLTLMIGATRLYRLP